MNLPFLYGAKLAALDTARLPVGTEHLHGVDAYSYGQKLAAKDEETTRNATSDALGLGAAASGAYALTEAVPRVTGRTTLHHGTTPSIKKKIVQEGLKPSAAVSSPSLTEQVIPSDLKQKAKSLAYMSESPFEARTYAGQAEFLARGGNVVKDDVGRTIAGYGAGLNPFHKGVATAKVPLWHPEVASKLRPNPEARGTFEEFKKHLPVNLMFLPESSQRTMWEQLSASKAFDGGLDTKWFLGANNYQPVSLSEMRQYARANPLRFAGGVGLGALGLAGLGYGAHRLYQNYKEPEQG